MARNRFNLTSEIHNKSLKRVKAAKIVAFERGKYLSHNKYKNFKRPSYQIKCLKASVDGKPVFTLAIDECTISVY